MHAQPLKYHPLETARSTLAKALPRTTNAPCSSFAPTDTSPDHRATSDARVATRKIALVVRELLQTEIAYLNSLNEIKEGYYLPLIAEGEFDAGTIDAIFTNILQLHAFHQSFSGELSRNSENLVGLANAFLHHAVDFEELYVEFCTEHSLSIQTLEQEYQMQTALWTRILACQAKLRHVLPFSSYLLKPVQRILKYQLLLQELVKGCTMAALSEQQSIFGTDVETAIEQLQSALERMIQVATHINEAKRRHELIGQLRASGLNVDQWGNLLLKDVFRLPAKKHACRLALLFERAILLAKKFTCRSNSGNNSAPNLTDLETPSGRSLGSVLEICDIISCDNLMLIECIDKNPLAFHILPFNNPNAQKTLQAASIEVKQLWCLEIKKVILENFDAAIPETAKRLMLNIAGICPKPQTSTDTFPQPCAAEDSEEPIPRRKGSSVLTAIFKRRNWSSRPALRSDLPDDPPHSASAVDEVAGSSDNQVSPGDADHVALVQDAWNRLMAKHSTASLDDVKSDVDSTTSSSAFGPATPAFGDITEVGEEEDDFRCIAVEINEERFAVDFPSPQRQRDPTPKSPSRARQNGALRRPLGNSIYIDCQEVSQYDTVTFGRAYEQYIEKTRSMATLSPSDLDEILRPLVTLSEERVVSSNGNAGSTRSANGNGVAAEASASVGSGDESSDSMSVCNLVSRIAIDTSRLTPAPSGSALKQPPAQTRHREPPTRSKVDTKQPVTSPRPRRYDHNRTPSARKTSAPSPSAKAQRPSLTKPPRTVASAKTSLTDSTLYSRSNQLANGGSRKQPSRLDTSLPPSLNEAATVCHGRFRAAVANLRPVNDVDLSRNPPKPSKPPRTSSTGPRRSAAHLGGSTHGTSCAASSSKPPETTLGHVKDLISQFQNG
ncbi:unnamed protein product [Mesocestoides corti]|uniref:DH domain-containing protein n=3 Tax=Mesocestoides corti TaxID=53468 RepID=A0A158QSB2_MESCO|nr:unnamed protein product [Mesocestoides corti]